MNAYPPPGFDPITIGSLASFRAWVAWQTELRNGTASKIPYVSKLTKARANAGRWLTREQAEKLADLLPKPLGVGGIGIEFFTTDDGRSVGGLDLDSCRDPATGSIEAWALDVVEVFDSYTEVSPSGTGAKIFFTFASADLPRLQAAMGTKFGKAFKRGSGKHPPAIELQLGNRYFCVTEELLDGMPLELRHIDAGTILDLILRVGPEFSGKAGAGRASPPPGADPAGETPHPDHGDDNPELLARIINACFLKPWLAKRWNGDWSGLTDQSGSGRAFTLGAALKRAGFSCEDMIAALLMHSDTREWASTKGQADNRRELLRIWEHVEVRSAKTRADRPGERRGGDDRDKPPPPWAEFLLLDDRGNELGNLANAAHALRQAPELAGILAYDEMMRHTLVTRSLPGSRMAAVTEPRPMQDTDVGAIQEWLQHHELKRLGKEVTHQAIDMVGREGAFHPVRDYLTGLVWDGTPRIGNWLTCYLGADKTPYTQAIGRMFLIAMVARIMKPGCKADYMLVLEGDQGAKKSTACAILAGDWFSDSLPDVHNGDPVRLSMHLRGKWLIEVGEMSAISRAEAGALKAFLTQREERFIPKYGRNEVHEPRQCVFIGTTNKTAYLRDETGGRRFWPVKVGTIDTDALAKERDQLFAEAMVAYLKGERWWPSAELEREHIQPEQEARFEVDAWEQAIGAWLTPHDKDGNPLPDPKPKTQTTILELARNALFIDLPKIGTADQRRIAAALQRLGWTQKRDMNGRWWEPSGAGA